MEGKLTKENPIVEGIQINGEAPIAVYGTGAVRFLRKLGEGPYLPMTDAAGEELEFHGTSVIFNAEISNRSPQARFAIELIDGASVDYIVINS